MQCAWVGSQRPWVHRSKISGARLYEYQNRCGGVPGRIRTCDLRIRNLPLAEATKIPGPSKPAPQPERPPEPRRIVAQVRECLDNNDAAEIVEGYYDVKGGILYVWDAQNNSPLGNQPIKPGDNIEAAARKLLREKSGKHRRGSVW